MAPTDPSFAVRSTGDLAETLVCGVAEYGLAGLTATDYLVDHLELPRIDHVSASRLPTVTPFENGTPRRHTRLYGEAPVTAMLGELFVPPGAAEAFGRRLVEWADDAGVQEVIVLSGMPAAHGPDDHRAFYVASEGYQQRHDLGEIRAMDGGFLDGLNGAVATAGMDAGVDICVFSTPVHAQSPVAEAALRLLDALVEIHDLAVDTEPLRSFADELVRHYTELADRLNRGAAEDASEDRMYM